MGISLLNDSAETFLPLIPKPNIDRSTTLISPDHPGRFPACKFPLGRHPGPRRHHRK